MKHTPGPLFVTVEDEWPFKIKTKTADGALVFSRPMPRISTRQRNAKQALAGTFMTSEDTAAEHNGRALADEVLRAAAPSLLIAAQDALQRLRSSLQLLDRDEEYIDRETLMLRTAIANALGEQP